MPVVSVKVDDRLKKGMTKYRNEIDWPEEIRLFIASKIGQKEREGASAAVRRMLEGSPTLPKGTASKVVREDRDSGH